MSERSNNKESNEARYGRLCEYAFGEMGAAERAAFEVELAGDAELQQEHAELVATAEGVRSALPAEKLSPEMRATLSQAASAGTQASEAQAPFSFLSGQRKGLLQAAAALLVFIGVVYGIDSMLKDPMLVEGEHLADGKQPRKKDKLAKLDSSRRLKSKKEAQDSEGAVQLELSTESGELSGLCTAPMLPDAVILGKANGISVLDLNGFGQGPGSIPNGTETSGESKLGSLVDELGIVSDQPDARQQVLKPVGSDSAPRLVNNPVLPGAIYTGPFDALTTTELNDFGQGLGSPAVTQGSLTGQQSARQEELQETIDETQSRVSANDQVHRESSGLLKANSSTKGTFRGPGDTVPPAGGVGAGVARTPQVAAGPSSLAPRISGIRTIEDVPEDSPFASIGEKRRGGDEIVSFLRGQSSDAEDAGQSESKEKWSYWWEFDPSIYGGEGTAAQSQLLAASLQAPKPKQKTGSSEFFLGRGALEELSESVDDADGGRQAVPSREQVRDVTLRILQSCSIRPQESPKDMFFRAWGEHPFRSVIDEPLSTFGADVDTASYTLARRTLRSGRLPSKKQVRTEEFLNYFRADQPAPEKGQVFGLYLESAPSLFNTDPRVDMLRVTVRGQDVADFERKPLALTLVIDVSGSMDDAHRMPLVKRSLALLLTQLSYADSVSIVSFSTQANVLAEMTSAANRSALEESLSKIFPSGGTNIESGITAGFEAASRGLVEGAVNRVILLSDGVGNIGETDQQRILDKVGALRAQGIYLNTIGVGMGDHNDHFLEQLANRGDGQCQYFDSAKEAEKVLVNDLTKTLQPIARDVKIQVEFDPAQVQSYRQVGYENRAIAARDFRNDALDAGEINAGHQVTALYEIVRYPGARSGKPLATARVRYKLPFVAGAGESERAAGEKAMEISKTIATQDLLPSYRGASRGYRRALLVAQFAECLRRSVHARQDSLQILLEEVQALATELDDQEFYELKDLVALAVPMLIDEVEMMDRELQEMVDALTRLNYETARREQTRGEQEPDAELEDVSKASIKDLESRIERHLLAKAGLWNAPLQESLNVLGYGEGKGKR